MRIKFILKCIYVALISLIPMPCTLRAKLYGLIPNYKIANDCSIGASVILVSKLIMAEKSQIENLCTAKNVDLLYMGHGSVIRNLSFLSNVDCIELQDYSVVGIRNIISGPKEDLRPIETSFILGKNSVLSGGHTFDLCDSIKIGNNTVIGGGGVQFITHYFDLERNRVQASIDIGNFVYIGSSSIILPGINICDNVVINAGSVLNSNIDIPGVYSSNLNVKKIGEIHQFSRLYKDKIIMKRDGRAYIRLND